jgi:MFS family permease
MRGPFENRTFRRLFAGRVITNVGDSLYFVAAMWLVYSLTNDPFYTGVAGFLTMAPQAFQFLSGPLVDHWSIRRTLVGTQLMQAAVISLIPIAHDLGVLTVELVLIVMPLLSTLNQLVYPAHTAALPRILEDEELVAANSAFSIAYQGFDMVANGISGVLIGLLGAVALFAIDAVTFGLAALVFATLSIPPAGASSDGGREAGQAAIDDTSATDAVADGGSSTLEEPDSYLLRLREGVAAIRGTFLVWLVVGAALVNTTAGMVLTAIPPYADSLGVPPALAAIGPAGGYGILMAAFAGGNFLGALSATVISDRPFGRTMIVGFALAGVLWFAAIAVDWLPATAPLIALAFVPVGIVNVQLAAVIQSAPPEALVGRVSSMLGSASASMTPLGALVGGAVTSAFGPRVAMTGLGAGVLGFSLYVAVRPDLRALPAPDRTTVEIDLERTR